MRWWVYKCNSFGRIRSDVRGDWAADFDWWADDCEWGELDALPDLENLKIGHRIIAQQTDRHEIVGVLEVASLDRRRVRLRPLLRFAGVDLRSLRRRDRKLRKMRAFAPGRIATLYRMAASEAKYLLRQCAVGVVTNDVERLFQNKSLWRDIGPLRLPNPRWKLGHAADSWADMLGLPAGAVKIVRPSGQPARSDKRLGALQREWARKQ